MKLIDVERVAPVPWRNGGGVTRELWAWPSANPSANDWQVRISVADVAQAGPFSAFPGVDRWFAVLQGEGVVLEFAHGTQVLGPDDAPLRFDGEAAPGCRLRAGATRDLNLMTVRSAGQGSMQRVQAGVPWQDPAPVRAVFAATPLQLQVDAADPLELPAWTLAVHTSTAGPAWTVHGAAVRAWWLGFEPEGAVSP
jgi:environmental stress-induced protein Ves